MQLDMRAHFWPHFLDFGDLLGHIGSWPKNAFLKIKVQKFRSSNNSVHNTYTYDSIMQIAIIAI